MKRFHQQGRNSQDEYSVGTSMNKRQLTFFGIRQYFIIHKNAVIIQDDIKMTIEIHVGYLLSVHVVSATDGPGVFLILCGFVVFKLRGISWWVLPCSHICSVLFSIVTISQNFAKPGARSKMDLAFSCRLNQIFEFCIFFLFSKDPFFGLF